VKLIVNGKNIVRYVINACMHLIKNEV